MASAFGAVAGGLIAQLFGFTLLFGFMAAVGFVSFAIALIYFFKER